MTLASALALRTDSGANLLLTFTDSRLILGKGMDSAPAWTDTVIKAVGLGPRSVVLMAGSTTLPVITAAEGARGLIANANVNRLAQLASPMSLLEEARQFLSFHQCCFKSMPHSASHRTQAVMAGFFADGTPGLVKVSNLDDSASFEVFRPTNGGFAVATIGDPYFSGIATQAICEALLRRPSGQALISSVASVFWDVIYHEGVAGIGGGLCVGMCSPKHSCWQWPMVTLEGAAFYRGLPISEVPAEWMPSAISIRRDQALFAALERKCPQEGYPAQYPSPIVTGGAAELSVVIDLSDWKLSEQEAEILNRA